MTETLRVDSVGWRPSSCRLHSIAPLGAQLRNNTEVAMPRFTPVYIYARPSVQVVVVTLTRIPASCSCYFEFRLYPCSHLRPFLSPTAADLRPRRTRRVVERRWMMAIAGLRSTTRLAATTLFYLGVFGLAPSELSAGPFPRFLVPFKTRSIDIHARSWKLEIVLKDVVSLHYGRELASAPSISLKFTAHAETPILLLEDIEISLDGNVSFHQAVDVIRTPLSDLGFGLHDIGEVMLFYCGTMNAGLDITGGLNFTVGAKTSVPAGATATFVIIGDANSSATGWEASSFELIPFRLNTGSFNASAQLSLARRRNQPIEGLLRAGAHHGQHAPANRARRDPVARQSRVSRHRSRRFRVLRIHLELWRGREPEDPRDHERLPPPRRRPLPLR
ncbi:hypothetical protein DFH09DRAFT_1277570, partial [Mycena vulgaris]